jgi:hypothetical protein
MSQQPPSGLQAWAQLQLGKVLFKVYQAKTAWQNRFGRNAPPEGVQADERTTPIE